MKLLLFLLLCAKTPTSLHTLYNTLDSTSVSQNLAFYELYPETEEGKRALKRAWQLLNGPDGDTPPLSLSPSQMQGVISLVTRQSFQAPIKLTPEQLETIDRLAKNLPNRKLKGAHIWTLEELFALPSEEIDLSRGLLINQFDNREEVKQYEAALDLMALQIAARLPKTATPLEKVRAINQFIFQEMQFRFPPHSVHVKEIDHYTFLPSVLDGRQGVCLGVSILYLSLAQRLSLSLEIITPPGHIYVRLREKDQIVNIETTARGIDIPSEQYLGVNTRKLQERTLKEVIGLAFVNQASVAWGEEDYATTVKLYEKALPYLPSDPLLKLFLGINYLFVGKKVMGRAYLTQLQGYTFDYAISPETLPDDLLRGHIDAEGVKAIFLPVDETRESILQKQATLQSIVKRYPKFRDGLLQLATTWLQLGRTSEALETLERYHKLDPKNATVEYYLAILTTQRLDYNRAWTHLRQSESLAASRSHHPQALRSLRHQLRRLSPERVSTI